MTPPITLTTEELYDITGYTRAAEQLQWFKELGVPAKRRADGTVSVAREHYLRHGSPRAAEALKSRGVVLQSDKRSSARV